MIMHRFWAILLRKGKNLKKTAVLIHLQPVHPQSEIHFQFQKTSRVTLKLQNWTIIFEILQVWVSLLAFQIATKNSRYSPRKKLKMHLKVRSKDASRYGLDYKQSPLCFSGTSLRKVSLIVFFFCNLSSNTNIHLTLIRDLWEKQLINQQYF